MSVGRLRHKSQFLFNHINGVGGRAIDAPKLFGDLSQIVGDAQSMYGLVAGLRGDVTGLNGDITDCRGDCSGLAGAIQAVCRKSQFSKSSGLIYGDLTGVTSDTNGSGDDVPEGDVSNVTGSLHGEGGHILNFDLTNVRGKISPKLQLDVLGPFSGDISGLTGIGGNITGDFTNIYGKLNAGLTGDISGLVGDITGATGNATGIIGNLDECDITSEERTATFTLASILI